MKKILLIAILLLLAAGQGWAVTCTSSGNGNWNTAGTWDCGHVPANTDVVVVSHAVVWDVATIPATGSLAAVSGAGTVSLDMDAVCDTPCALTCTTITPGDVANLFAVSGAADTDNVVTFTASGAGGVTGGATSADVAINMTGAGVLNVVGNINGGGAATAYALVIQNGTYSLGGAGKTITAGTNVTAHAISIAGNADGGTITGDVIGGAGTVASFGVINSDYEQPPTLVGNLINGACGVPWSGAAPTWVATNGAAYYQNKAGTKLYADTDPLVANVKTGTTYYFQSAVQKTGTYSAGGGGAWGF